MFTFSDFNKKADPVLVEKILGFIKTLTHDQQEILYSLVIDRDDLIVMQEPVAVSDAELDLLIRNA